MATIAPSNAATARTARLHRAQWPVSPRPADLFGQHIYYAESDTWLYWVPEDPWKALHAALGASGGRPSAAMLAILRIMLWARAGQCDFVLVAEDCPAAGGLPRFDVDNQLDDPCDDEDVDVRRLLRLGIAHLPRELARHDVTGEGLACADGVVAYETGESWLMWVPDDPAAHASCETDRIDNRVLQIQRRARREGCDYVLLSSDGRVVDDLPTFDHD